MTRKKAYLIVEVELDPVPGPFHTVDSATQAIQSILSYSIGHYKPVLGQMVDHEPTFPLEVLPPATAETNVRETESPYMKGYREGRSGDTGSVDNAWNSRQKASYLLGYSYGVDFQPNRSIVSHATPGP